MTATNAGQRALSCPAGAAKVKEIEQPRGELLLEIDILEVNRDAARRLGIAGVERLPAIYVGDEIYLVIGILRDVVRKPELLGSVIIPEGTARRHFSLFGPGMVVVETKIGAASLIALQARAALSIAAPSMRRLGEPMSVT